MLWIFQGLSANNAVNLIASAEQQLSQIRAVLSINARYQCSFHLSTPGRAKIYLLPYIFEVRIVSTIALADGLGFIGRCVV